MNPFKNPNLVYGTFIDGWKFVAQISEDQIDNALRIDHGELRRVEESYHVGTFNAFYKETPASELLAQKLLADISILLENISKSIGE